MGQTSGVRLQKYDSTFTSAGRRLTDVTMDQYGRIFEYTFKPRYNAKGKRLKDKGDWFPTGECGVARH